MEVRIISIGALEAHPLWNESTPVRTGHATTTLVRTKDATILVDPGLPAQILEARLRERANLAPKDITHVFLTSFRPDVRRGLALFENAQWLVGEMERESVGVPLVHEMRRAAEQDEPELAAALELDISMLKRCQSAPDQVAGGVSLFPLPGVTQGLCGLLVAYPRHTTLICGDAIPTIEHLEQGKAPKWAQDVTRALESLAEAIEIADILVLGRDNITINPVKRPF